MNFKKYSLPLTIFAYYCAWGLYWTALCANDSYKSCVNAATSLGVTSFPISITFMTLEDKNQDYLTILGLALAGALQWFMLATLAIKFSWHSRAKQSTSYILTAVISIFIPMSAIAIVLLIDVLSDALSPVGGTIFTGMFLILAYQYKFSCYYNQRCITPMIVLALSLITFAFIFPFLLVSKEYGFEYFQLFVSTEIESVVTAVFAVVTLVLVSLIEKIKHKFALTSEHTERTSP